MCCCSQSFPVATGLSGAAETSTEPCLRNLHLPHEFHLLKTCQECIVQIILAEQPSICITTRAPRKASQISPSMELHFHQKPCTNSICLRILNVIELCNPPAIRPGSIRAASALTRDPFTIADPPTNPPPPPPPPGPPRAALGPSAF